jgi:hypothetical protein
MQSPDASHSQLVSVIGRDQLNNCTIAFATQDEMLIVRQVNDFSPRLRVSAVNFHSSVKVAATQKEAAGLAHHFAA